jgi:hypothetical protein
MPARSDEDCGAEAGCGDGERRVRRWPVEVGGGESVWAGLRSGYRKHSIRALVRACNVCVSRMEEEEELTFGPACKREGGE